MIRARAVRLLVSPILWRIIAALFLASCTASRKETPKCTTSCGLVGEGFDCRDFRIAELGAVVSLGKHVSGWSIGGVCGSLSGWTVRVHKQTVEDLECTPPAWRWHGTFCVRGYTDDLIQTIWLADEDVLHGAFAHEIVHVVDLKTKGHAGHCNWGPRGILAGLKEATGEQDPTPQESSCSD